MIVPDFTISAAAYIPNAPHPVFSTPIEQRARGCVYIIGHDDKLFCQLSSLRKKTKETATTEQFKRNRHNFDIVFEQIDVKDVEWFSFFKVFDFYKNLAAEQNTLTYCYEQTRSNYFFGKVSLQSALSFYNAENLNGSAGAQIVNSYTKVKADKQRGEDLQESIRLKKEEVGTQVGSLPLSSEELEDAFTHKESSGRDAFSAEDSSSSTKQLR
ncbi:TrwN protein [Bartonella tribocorum]|uniref:TrwN protein n=1 Tax=Bartonella tribocorum TaxID=85701 RepID=A0A2M6UW64_9HYPH|nr:TrwN protein [Bartonella tribocorum]PIT70409.1 TrwN protein [Bartonella tribocorum]